MNPLHKLIAMTVPTRLLKVVAAACAPPGEAADPMITQAPDTWLPPWWVHVDKLGAQHPNRSLLAADLGKRVHVTQADIDRCAGVDPIAAMYRAQRGQR